MTAIGGGVPRSGSGRRGQSPLCECVEVEGNAEAAPCDQNDKILSACRVEVGGESGTEQVCCGTDREPVVGRLEPGWEPVRGKVPTRSLREELKAQPPRSAHYRR